MPQKKNGHMNGKMIGCCGLGVVNAPMSGKKALVAT